MDALKAAALVLMLALFAAPAHANPFAYGWEQVAPGVWAGIRPDPFELPQEGNAVFVVTSEGVVLFDAGGSPAMGESIVAKVRSVTDRPITHVVLSHWHGDHMRGLQAIVAAFPQAQVYAHPHTRDFIASTQERWLKRRVSMVPNIRKGVAAALEQKHDLAGRPLIPEEERWLRQGLANCDTLDRENNRTTYVLPTATFADSLTLRLGGREIDFRCPGPAHTAGDVVMWLPADSVVATGDIVTAPIPLMPSPYTGDYAAVLARIQALGFRTLVPGHGAVQHDARYLGLLGDLVHEAAAQMKPLVAQGLAQADAEAKVDLSQVEKRFTHGDPFLMHRFEDYVTNGGLLDGAYLVASGKGPNEAF